MGQPVVYFEVVGTDGPALRSYYGDLFGWQFNAPIGGPMDYATLVHEDAEPGVPGGVGGTDGYGGHVTFYVQVPDVEAALVKAESLGGKREAGPDEIPGMGIEIGRFTDPEGHVLGLVSPPPA